MNVLTYTDLISCICSGLRKQPIDLERKPLLYDYYANTLNPIYDKRNFDEIDAFAMPTSAMLKRQQFDDITNEKRAVKGISNMPYLHLDNKRDDMSEFSNQHKRNFDEIDAFAMPSFLYKRSRLAHQHYDTSANKPVYSTRVYLPQFNEVEPTTYADLRQYMDESAGGASSAGAASLTTSAVLNKTPESHALPANPMIMGKRNFDEIDQFAMPPLMMLQSSLKRRMLARNRENDAGGRQKKSIGAASVSSVAKQDHQGQSERSGMPATDNAAAV